MLNDTAGVIGAEHLNKLSLVMSMSMRLDENSNGMRSYGFVEPHLEKLQAAIPNMAPTP